MAELGAVILNYTSGSDVKCIIPTEISPVFKYLRPCRQASSTVYDTTHREGSQQAAKHANRAQPPPQQLAQVGGSVGYLGRSIPGHPR